MRPRSSASGTATPTSRSPGTAMVRQLKAMNAFFDAGVPTFEYGNQIRRQSEEHGIADAMKIPGFVSAYLRPLFLEGRGPFRWTCISGDPADLARLDDLVPGAVRRRRAPHPLDRSGPPARPDRGPAGPRVLPRLRSAQEVRPGRQRAHQVRRGQGPGRVLPRQPRLRLDHQPHLRVREHARRLRRHLRLAVPQRPAQRLGDVRPDRDPGQLRDGRLGPHRRHDDRRRHRRGCVPARRLH